MRTRDIENYSEGFRRARLVWVDGSTREVLNGCLRKNVDSGIINRVAYLEIPACVEYEIAAFGRKFIGILDKIAELQRKIEAKCETSPSRRPRCVLATR